MRPVGPHEKKTRDVWAWWPQHGPRGLVGSEKVGYTCWGGVEVEGTESVAARRGEYHPWTCPFVSLTALAHPEVIPARRAAGGGVKCPG